MARHIEVEGSVFRGDMERKGENRAFSDPGLHGFCLMIFVKILKNGPEGASSSSWGTSRIDTSPSFPAKNPEILSSSPGDAQEDRQATFHLDERILVNMAEGRSYLLAPHRHGLVHHHL